MARELTFEERKRQREEEDEKEGSLSDKRRGVVEKPGAKEIAAGGTGSDNYTDKLVELFQRAEPLIEQVNNLYNQYIAGVESRPPVERRKQLEQLMGTLQAMSKPTPSYQFRYNTLNTAFMTHRERWDRMLRDLESGKLKRR